MPSSQSGTKPSRFSTTIDNVTGPLIDDEVRTGNSGMQVHAAHPLSRFDIILNPSFPTRFLHMPSASPVLPVLCAYGCSAAGCAPAKAVITDFSPTTAIAASQFRRDCRRRRSR